MSENLIVTLACNVAGGLIVTALVAVIKWQVGKFKGNLPGLKDRLIVWLYLHLNAILLTGIIIDAFLLGWLLIKYPTVNLWTVLAIVVCIVLTAVQLALYLLNRIINSILESFQRLFKSLTKNIAPE
jgi:hypothetical protein